MDAFVGWVLLTLRLTLILLGQIPSELLPLLCNAKLTRALSIVHPPTPRVVRISWSGLLLVNVGRGGPLMTGLTGRSHETRAATSTNIA